MFPSLCEAGRSGLASCELGGATAGPLEETEGTPTRGDEASIDLDWPRIQEDQN